MSLIKNVLVAGAVGSASILGTTNSAKALDGKDVNGASAVQIRVNDGYQKALPHGVLPILGAAAAPVAAYAIGFYLAKRDLKKRGDEWPSGW